ncbi:alpha/beta hydrolase [Terasakiella sp. A23]|uniref:alpha/beta hydrolase n=1 Tax=Terasakiella sp. FCG-A23 TaxID=3080561 RepID=UPI002955398A|nr:alpha/beta hydrolase [Terasakiella sp. A23]MDV7339880.1 alpha/beta hydrolase [Terasakiella sp. A23]
MDESDPTPDQSIYFCERTGKGKYTEIGSQTFLENLRGDLNQQIILYIHGFNNMPEPDVFPRAEALQKLFNDAAAASKEDISYEVVVLLWPCDASLGMARKYWDDQKSSEMSSFGFSRMLERFMDWRSENNGTCFRPINILAHSMGNRVLRLTLKNWANDKGMLPALFRNIFMVAPDVANETLEKGNSGYFITQAARNVAVYYANDDLAMSASKVANLKNRVATRRLGHTGPERMDKVSDNVYAIDCDNVNNKYDRPKGHSYFLKTNGTKGSPGVVFKHIFNSCETGRIKCDPVTRRWELKKK